MTEGDLWLLQGWCGVAPLRATWWGMTPGVYAGSAPHRLGEQDKAASFRLGGGGHLAVSSLLGVPTAALDKLPQSDAELTHHARHTRAARWGD